MRKFNLKDKAAERMMNPEAEKPAAEPKEERAESPVSGFSIASRTDVGRVRKSNQDALIIGEGIAGVADGMGGHNGGEIASGETRDGILRELTEIQRKMLDTVCAYVREGGTLVYSTCSILPEENEQQAEDFLRRHPEFEAAALPETVPEKYTQYRKTGLQLLEYRDGVEGFYVCRFRRKRI